MWKTRPVVVMSYKNTLHGTCMVVPLTTEPQGSSPWAWELSTSLDGRRTWVVCNYPYTVSTSRFFQPGRQIPLISKADFNEVLARLANWLPKPFELDN